MDKSRYGPSAFKRNKSVGDNARRFWYELRRHLANLSDRKAAASFNKYLNRIQAILHGDHKLSRSPNIHREVASAFAQDDLPLLIIQNLHVFGFELRQSLIDLITGLVGQGGGIEEGLASHISIVFNILTSHYTNRDMAMVSGQFLRDVISSNVVHAQLLKTQYIDQLMQFITIDTFEIQSDAFDTVKHMLTIQHRWTSEFITQNFQYTFNLIKGLMSNESYYLKRQALALYLHLLQSEQLFLGSVVKNEENLMEVMTMLNTKGSSQIRLEAIFLFKLMIAEIMPNQERYEESFRILRKNKERLVKHFAAQTDKTEEDFAMARNEILSLLAGIN